MNPPCLPYCFCLAAAAMIPTLAHSEDAKPDPLALATERSSAYMAAWEKGDASALTALYAPDANYTTDEGEVLVGRETIGQRASAALEANAGSVLVISVESARFLTPDVLVEKGYASLATDEGESLTEYTATHVKQDGQWLISEVSELSLSPADPGSEALLSLEWLIGTWKLEGDENRATIEADWSLEGRFITRTTRLAAEEGGEPFVSVEVIGYDPVRDQIRSWLFDNEGGFGEGYWSQDGDRWLVGTRAVDPSGSASSADHLITFLDEGRIGVESINRVVEGEALPNRDQLVLVRTAAPESQAAAGEADPSPAQEPQTAPVQ